MPRVSMVINEFQSWGKKARTYRNHDMISPVANNSLSIPLLETLRIDRFVI